MPHCQIPLGLLTKQKLQADTWRIEFRAKWRFAEKSEDLLAEKGNKTKKRKQEQHAATRVM